MSIEQFICDRQENKKLITDYYEVLRERQYNKGYDSHLEAIAGIRGFKVETLKEAGWVYIDAEEEMLIPKYLDRIQEIGIISPNNKRPIFHKRFLIPIKDTDGLILNFVGYSREADERYVYGTAPYYRRREDMYGLENLNVAYELGWGILTEGITDTTRLRELGFKNSFGNCGTHGSTCNLERLNRCEYGVIKIPDRDKAGKEAVAKWKTFRSCTINTCILYKDVDSMCKEEEENKQIVINNVNSAVEWLKMNKHRGMDNTNIEITM